MGGYRTLKRSRRYSDDGYSRGGGDGKRGRRRVGWQRHVDNYDFLDGNEDNNQQEIQCWSVDGILLPPATLLMRIGGGLLQTGTNNGGGGASGDDNVEDDDDRAGG